MSELPINKSNSKSGYCGKVPSLGDFVCHGLSSEFVDSWQEWLDTVLVVSQEQLGSRWLKTYLTSPIWHFALSPGICSDSAMLGTLMPSVDNAGRHYPFTLATETPLSPVQCWHKPQWAAQAEELILQVLEDELDLEQWFTQGHALLSTNQQSGMEVSTLLTDSSKKSWYLEFKLNAPLRAEQAELEHEPPVTALKHSDSPVLAMLHQSYLQSFKHYSLWWTQGSEQVLPCLLVTEGLPQMSQFSAMLDGQWQRWAWNMSQITPSK